MPLLQPAFQLLAIQAGFERVGLMKTGQRMQYVFLQAQGLGARQQAAIGLHDLAPGKRLLQKFLQTPAKDAAGCRKFCLVQTAQAAFRHQLRQAGLGRAVRIDGERPLIGFGRKDRDCASADNFIS